MADVNPKLTPAKLRESARRTSDGSGPAPLPGVRTDAKAAAEANTSDPASPYYGSTHHDPDGYIKNRELAEQISKAVEQIKISDEHGPRFVLAWRMYPNKDHPVWQQKDVHFCGCGCGCSAPGPYEPSRKPAGKPSKRGRAGKRTKKVTR